MLKHVIAIVGLCLLGVATLAADKEPQKVDKTGKLQTGIVAIGGETTGTIIETKDGSFELDFAKNKEGKALLAKAEKLNGKMVDVSGTLEIRKGVEVKERKIITVTKLEVAKGK